ncbi:hypothetical protein BC827DRAFT_1381680 [Russula dissimulans]|nr:hypothetical protein BC827DRAFT_1381680 [Russula dissimulans]
MTSALHTPTNALLGTNERVDEPGRFLGAGSQAYWTPPPIAPQNVANKDTPPKATTANDREQQRHEGRCFWCNTRGHLARNCPSKDISPSATDLPHVTQVAQEIRALPPQQRAALMRQITKNSGPAQLVQEITALPPQERAVLRHLIAKTNTLEQRTETTRTTTHRTAAQTRAGSAIPPASPPESNNRPRMTAERLARVITTWRSDKRTTLNKALTGEAQKGRQRREQPKVVSTRSSRFFGNVHWKMVFGYPCFGAYSETAHAESRDTVWKEEEWILNNERGAGFSAHSWLQCCHFPPLARFPSVSSNSGPTFGATLGVRELVKFIETAQDLLHSPWPDHEVVDGPIRVPTKTTITRTFNTVLYFLCL